MMGLGAGPNTNKDYFELYSQNKQRCLESKKDKSIHYLDTNKTFVRK